MNSDSVSNLLTLWDICPRGEDDERQVLSWDNIREILDRYAEPQRIEAVLHRDFGLGLGLPHVNFMRFWSGMQSIMGERGTWDIGSLDVRTQELVESLESLRVAVIDRYGRERITLDGLRRLCEDRRRASVSRGPRLARVVAYWEDKLLQLPAGGTLVTEDEIGEAMRQWLQEMVGSSMGVRPEDDPLAWLAAVEQGEPEDVLCFHRELLEALDHCGPDVRFGQLYRATENALEQSFRRGEGRQAAFMAAVTLLGGVVTRQVRIAFRQWDVRRPGAAKRRSGGASFEDGTDDEADNAIMVGLICSQASAAQTLERRCCAIPWAYRLFFILARARRRSLYGAVNLWRQPPEARGTAPAPPPRLPTPGGLAPLRSPSPRAAPSSSPSASPSPRTAPTSAAPSPSRRWGAGNRSPSSSAPAVGTAAPAVAAADAAANSTSTAPVRPRVLTIGARGGPPPTAPFR